MDTAARFISTGLINSAFGFCVIFAAIRLGVSDYVANAAGYASGLVLSYGLNRKFTFATPSPPNPREFARFVGAATLAYLLNLAVIAVGHTMGLAGQPALHLAAMMVYSASFFLAMQMFVFAKGDSDVRPAMITAIHASIVRHACASVLALVTAATALALWGIPLTHDVVWQFWIARQMSQGAVLYRDILELNPPLWFWSAQPIVALADALHLAPLRIVVPIIVAWAGLAAWALGRLSGITEPWRRLVLMLLALWLCTVNPIYDFGQREQLALIAALPYAALLAARRRGEAIPVGLALAVALAAAYGFALKHLFVTIPLGLELWLIVGLRRRWRPLRIETVVIGVAALLYALAVLRFAPDFMTRVVPMVRAAYAGYESPLRMVLLRPWMVAWLVGVLYLVAYGRRIPAREAMLLHGLCIGAAGFAFAYFVQNKGWMYHSVPVTGMMGLAVAVCMTSIGCLPADTPTGSRRLPLALGVTCLAVPMLLPFASGRYHNPLRAEVDPLLATVSPGAAVYIAATDPMWAWPAVTEHGLAWRSRYYSLWMIPAIAHARMLGPQTPELRDLSTTLRRQVADEVRCSRPELILFETRRMYAYQPAAFHLRTYLEEEPALHDTLARYYAPLPTTRSIAGYRRVAMPPAFVDRDCPALR